MSDQLFPPLSSETANSIGSQQSSAQTKKRTPQIMALESAGLGTWWWNLATDEVVCDSRFKSLVGIPQNEPNILLMSSILAHLQVADVELTKSAIKESVNINGEFDIFHRVVWPDDTIHWVRLKGGPLKQGPDTEMCGIAIDGKWAAELKTLCDEPW